MLLLTAGLAAYVLLHERRQPPRDLAGFLLFDLEGDILKDEAVSLEITPDDIGRIDVKSTTSDLSFRRSEDGTWDLTRGMRDRAARPSVKTLLDFVSNARILDTLDMEEVRTGKVAASAIGLDDSGAVEITYRKPGGARLVTFKAGRTAPLGKAMYVQFNDVKSRRDVYIVTPDLRDFLTQPPDEFRDRVISKYPYERIRKFSVKRGTGEIEVTRESTHESDGTPWVISRPLANARADQEVVASFLGMITGAKLSSFSSTTGSGTALPADQILVEVTLWPDGAYDRKGVTLTFYPDADPNSKEAICRDRERKIEFKVDRELVDSIGQAESPNIFRDPVLGNIDPAKVMTLEVDPANGDKVGLYRIGERWVMRKMGTEEFQVASGEAVEKLIKAINAAEVLEFSNDALTDKPAFGLDQPNVTLTFATGKHAGIKQLAALTTDNSRILRLGVLPTGKVYANFAGEPFVYQVGPEIAGLVPRQMIRWRTLQLPGFDRIQLRAVRQTIGAAPPVELEAEPNSFVWTAQRSGEVVTPLLDTAAAESIASRLGSMQVASWQGESEVSLRALANAPIVLEAAYETPAAGNGAAAKTHQIRIELAPMSTDERAPLYYGRHSAVPGIFLIGVPTVKELTTPLLKAGP
jgi:hypothetical protein